MNHLISDMLAIADEKRLQMLELLQLTKEQSELLAGGDVEKLERHIEYKQNIIDRVNALDARYKELNMQLLFEAGLCRIEDLKNDDDVQRIRELNTITTSIVEEMVEIDNHNAEMGRLLLEKLGEALKQAGKAPAASRAYQGGMSGAIFINRQG